MHELNLADARVLIIDDQEPNIRVLESILKKGGFHNYRSLRDARAALPTFLEYRPDLILLDCMMPYMDGMGVMELLKPHLEGTFVPILMLTADASTETKRKALAAGAKDFLTKPLDLIEVLLRIKNLLETRFLYLQLQQRANQRIEEQSALLDRANDAIIVEDLEKRVTFWNAGAERMYGWTAAETVGKNALELMMISGSPEHSEAEECLRRDGRWEGELHTATRERKGIHVASRWTLVRDEKGVPKAKLMINTDISEKKRLANQLTQAHRLESIGMLAGGVAHDFNNLLTVITGYGDILLSKLADGEPTRELVHEIQRASERAAGLTRQLLAFSRKAVVAPRVVNLNNIIEDTSKMLRRIIGEHITLLHELDPELGNIKVDPSQVDQLLVNLVVNARDAMPQGGSLRITTLNVNLDKAMAAAQVDARPGQYVMLSVSDTGSGMSDEVKVRVFEPFFTTKEQGKGTGLGLATVYGVVQQAGGFIELDSSIGAGTCFRVFLPACEQELSQTQGQSRRPSSSAGFETVLLVEDEPAVRALSKHALCEEGYLVIEACNGAEALARAEKYPSKIDLLVSDVVMPGMGGRVLAQELQQIKPEMKALFLTGYTDDSVMLDGIANAGVQILAKPFGTRDLVDKVRNVLDGV